MSMDLSTVSEIHSACCGCGLPECAENSIKCESLTRTSYCADDDYTDAVEEWEAARDQWVAEGAHNQWEVEHGEWEDARDAWVAADPENRDPEDYPEPEPSEPGEANREPEDYPESEPEKPEGYDDVDHGCYAPYAAPEVGPDEPLPTIYRTYRMEYYTSKYNGESHTYRILGESGDIDEVLIKFTYVLSSAPTTEERTGNHYAAEPPPSCGPLDSGVMAGMGGVLAWGVAYVDGEMTYDCTAATRVIEQIDTSTSGTLPLALQGCPGPWSPPGIEQAWDFTREFKETQTVESGISREDLIARARGRLPEDWPETPVSTACGAALEVEWPTPRDFFSRGGGAWPGCDSAWFSSVISPPGHSIPAGITVHATARKGRYQVGVPSGYMAHRLWLVCEAETPGECGPEPQIFKYFAMQWDMVFFPATWDAWRTLKEAYKAAVEAHAEWVIAHAAWVIAHAEWVIAYAEWEQAWDDYMEDYDEWLAAVWLQIAWNECEIFTPGECGPAPEEPGEPPEEPGAAPEEPIEPEEPPAPPADPGPQPDDRPVFVDENLFWEWTGGETEASQYSGWYEVEAPETAGEVRMVNRQVKCWRSAKFGAPPTYYGEIYNPADYDEE